MPINLIRLLIIGLGLPHSMDTVISWSGNKRTYFFKDKSYWKLIDHSLKLNEGYPRDITQIWMNLDCSKRSDCRDGGKTCEQGKHRSPSPSPPTPSLPSFVFPTFWLCATTIYYHCARKMLESCSLECQTEVAEKIAQKSKKLLPKFLDIFI